MLQRLRRFFYLAAIRTEPTNSPALNNYACFLRQQNQMDEAEKYHLAAIEANPNNVIHLRNYAAFLIEVRNKPEDAENFLTLAAQTEKGFSVDDL